jgi:hypothetical protein
MTMNNFPSGEPVAAATSAGNNSASTAAAIASEAVAAVALASICGANSSSIQLLTAPVAVARSEIGTTAEPVSAALATSTRIRLPSIDDIIGGSVAAAAAAAIPPLPVPVAPLGAPVATVSASSVAVPVPGVGADGQRLVFAPIHPGTVGRVQSACTHHRQIKKRCPDDCAHKQRELAQSELDRVMAGETRPVAVVVPLEKLRAESARKRELTLHKRRLKKVAKVAALNHEASSVVAANNASPHTTQMQPQFVAAAAQQQQHVAAHLAQPAHAHLRIPPLQSQATSMPQFLPPAAALMATPATASNVGACGFAMQYRADFGGFPELFKAAALVSGAPVDDEDSGVAKQQPKRRRRRITVDLGDISSVEDRDQASDEEFRL